MLVDMTSMPRSGTTSRLSSERSGRCRVPWPTGIRDIYPHLTAGCGCT